jgi:ketosteroid isomerase-like protein
MTETTVRVREGRTSMKRGAAIMSLLALLGSAARAQTNEEQREEVRGTEAAFAKTMADRDHAAFTSFLATETVFLGQQAVRRGKASVAEAWKPFYEGKDAPFSWAPESVEVLDSGGLALSSGPVFDPAGQRVGTFTSVWRKEKDGKWRIVFDKGCPPCACSQPERKSTMTTPEERVLIPTAGK